MKSNHIIAINIDNWDSISVFSRHLKGWCFRGQANSEWTLSTSLERAFIHYDNIKNIGKYNDLDSIYKFQRIAHHYMNNPPPMQDYLEWLALLQHYGCPTRLLDFTWSIYIAAFFSIEMASTDSAIWAINASILKRLVDKTFSLNNSEKDWRIKNSSYIKLVENIIEEKKAEDIVILANPERLNERNSIQKGLFLFNGNNQKTFEENLLSTFGITDKKLNESWNKIITPDQFTVDDSLFVCIIKLILPKSFHSTAIRELNDMNITAVTLFPGLDGFARSLRIKMRPLIDMQTLRDVMNLVTNKSK